MILIRKVYKTPNSREVKVEVKKLVIPIVEIYLLRKVMIAQYAGNRLIEHILRLFQTAVQKVLNRSKPIQTY
jgi:hypothetical protein